MIIIIWFSRINQHSSLRSVQRSDYSTSCRSYILECNQVSHRDDDDNDYNDADDGAAKLTCWLFLPPSNTNEMRDGERFSWKIIKNLTLLEWNETFSISRLLSQEAERMECSSYFNDSSFNNKYRRKLVDAILISPLSSRSIIFSVKHSLPLLTFLFYFTSFLL